MFVGFGWLKGGLGRWAEAVEVECESRGVGLSGVERVSEVHEESVAAPSEAILNERVQELGAVEEVGGCDSDGVSRPSRDVGMFGW